MPPMVTQTAAEWRLLDFSSDSVFHNLAFEEAVARSACSPEFTPSVRVWVNPPSVILGRFQQITAEVDVKLCEQRGIQIARRFTGGGAVYHDEGNLNFTIVIRTQERPAPNEFQKLGSSIIMDTLSGLGLEGSLFPPNSFLLGKRKVAGAATAFGKNFALWHSSILVSTDIRMLEEVLAPSKNTNVTGYVRSRWLPVTSLQGALKSHLEAIDVKKLLVASAEKILGQKLRIGRVRNDEVKLSDHLYTQKYALPEWNQIGTCETVPRITV